MHISGNIGRKCLLAAGLICLICAMLLSGCSHEEALPSPTQTVQPTPEPTETPRPKITLDTQSVDGAEIPQIAGHPNTAEINRKLEAYYAPIAEATEAWVHDSEYREEHRLTEEDGTYRLESVLSYYPYGTVELGAVTISHESDDITVITEPNPEALSDAVFMKDLAVLMRFGVELGTEDYGAYASQALMHRLFVMGYEHLARAGIQHDGIAGDVEDATLRKALKLELVDYYPGMDAGAGNPVYILDLQRTLAFWAVAVERDIYQQYSRNATVQDAMDMMQLFMDSVDWSGVAEDLVRNADPEEDFPDVTVFDDFSQVFAEDDIEQADDEITRLDLASIMVPVYEDIFGEIDLQSVKSHITEPADTDDPVALKAMARMIMVSYPSYSTFEPDLSVQFYALPSLINRFTNQVYLDMFYASGYLELPAVRTEELVRACIEILDHYEAREPISIPAQQVSLDREWDWYMNQYDTGAYNYINCMPTLAAMVMKWLDPESTVTPQELRESVRENTGGWYMSDVENVLDRYGVRYTSRKVSLQNIMDDINMGNVAFCQINEGDLKQNGHCFLVYGYRKQGDNLWLLVQDPASAFVNQYGEPEGKNRMIDAHYAEWIISRFSTRYLSIPPIASNLQ